MASIRKEARLPARADDVWSAIRDVGAAARAFPGVLTDSRLDGDVRTVTFANGQVVRERIVDVDDGARRLAYAAFGGRATHHNASLQVFDDGDGCRVVWITDLLPNELAPAIAGLMEHGLAALRRAVERA